MLVWQSTDLRFDQNAFTGYYEQQYGQRITFSNKSSFNAPL